MMTMRKLPKILVAFTFIGGIGLLVACGGGGGGSTPSTPSAPGNPGAPSGGATTPPSGTTTAPATTTPNPTPTPKGATPSPTPTVTPTPTLTPTPTPTPTATAHAGTTQINVGYGETNGGTNDLLISTASNTQGYSGGGNLMPGQTGATAAGGGQGNPVDGVSCQPSMSGNYHVHFFLGVFYNGQEIMVPAGLGMVNPSPPNQSVLNDQVVATGTAGAIPNQSWTANCYYDVHVHDNSGMVHVESTNNGNNCGSAVGGPTPPPCSYSIYNFQQFLDEWGISVSATNFGPLTGPVQVYTQANPPAPYCMNPCTVNASTLSFYAAGASGLGAIPIYSHTVIWIVIGTPPSSGLPNVFFEEGDP